MTSTSSATAATGINLDFSITGANEGTGDITTTSTTGYILANMPIPSPNIT
ncbi:hypothetical protein [Cyclobacterium amurskyense]|uniref:hypothetical protein n=1 Tax=Cyclobacterium amurskyense TaxID=320787 RepID=UPI0030DC4CB6